ncbi:MAG: squalene synthase HpnC [Phycisphaerales bacterium]
MAPATIDPRMPVMDALRRFGPREERVGEPRAATDSAPQEPPPTLEESLAYVRGLATSHYENFSVLSSLVPEELRDDFAAVYAFCRWADDLGDETGRDDAGRARSLALLGWWREQTTLCLESPGTAPTHPVFVALRRTHERHHLPSRPFLDLIDAFEQDQRVRRYQTWDEVIEYCRRSANPVGRIVLHLGGYPECAQHAQRYAMSDSICTALQLTNHWQDVRRDLLERDRVYLPEQETGFSAETLRAWADRREDPAARVAYIKGVRRLVERTWPLFVHGEPLPRTLSRRIAPVVWLFGAGGRAVLNSIERTGCTTLWVRPRLGRLTKGALVARAWAASRLHMGRSDD